MFSSTANALTLKYHKIVAVKLTQLAYSWLPTVISVMEYLGGGGKMYFLKLYGDILFSIF